LLFALGIAVLLLGALQQLNAGLMSLATGAGRSVLRPFSLAAAFVLGASGLWFASARAHVAALVADAIARAGVLP
jgi:hypothetical protein